MSSITTVWDSVNRLQYEVEEPAPREDRHMPFPAAIVRTYLSALGFDVSLSVEGRREGVRVGRASTGVRVSVARTDADDAARDAAACRAELLSRGYLCGEVRRIAPPEGAGLPRYGFDARDALPYREDPVGPGWHS